MALKLNRLDRQKLYNDQHTIKQTKGSALSRIFNWINYWSVVDFSWFFYDFYLPHIGDINGNLEQRQSRKKLIPLGNLMASRKPGNPMIKIGWQDSGQIGYMITSCHSVWNIHSRGKGNWTLVTARTRRGTASHKAGMLESQKAAVIYYCRCYW